MQNHKPKSLYSIPTIVSAIFRHTIQKIILLTFVVTANVSANDTGEFYYMVGTGLGTFFFTSPVDAANTSIDWINASGSNFTLDSITWDDCPRLGNAHCATGEAVQSQYPFGISIIIASSFTQYALAAPVNNKQPNCTLGNPIDPVTGNKLQQEQLIEINAIHPITLDLFYNSNRLEKWRHTYSRTLTFSDTCSVQLYHHKISQIIYQKI